MKTENGAETTYTYNALNQLTAETGVTYQYDDAGNLISATSNEKSTLYAYNAENKLIRATVNEAGKTVVEEYTYDYAGNRTSKTTGSETVKFLNDNSVLTNVLAELDADGNELCYYTIGADLISQERSGKTALYLYDGHGSVRGLIDENGKVTDTYNYDAFGNLLDKIGTTVNNYLYCGEQFDTATGLYYLRARYMNPATGTFISMDTYQGSVFDPTSLHKYLYANANPVMYTDPSGYFGLADFSVSSAMSNAISTVQNDAFAMAVWRSFKAGFVCAGLDVYRQLRTNGAIDWGNVIETLFVSSAAGVVFGGSAILAATLKSAAIYTALGGSCFTFFGLSLAQAQADGEAGYYDLMFLDLVFSGLSLKGAKNCFDNAFEIATATNTAKTTTNTSVNNTNTAQNSNSNTPSELTRVGRWMSKAEYEAMVETGKVQMSPDGNRAYVASPADINAFGKQAKPGSVYVEFDVDASCMYPAGKSEWGQIPGPGSLYDRLLQSKGNPAIKEMPNAYNIILVGEK